VVVHHLAQMPLTRRSRRFKARCCSGTRRALSRQDGLKL
jgi:hypothetical protein